MEQRARIRKLRLAGTASRVIGRFRGIQLEGAVGRRTIVDGTHDSATYSDEQEEIRALLEELDSRAQAEYLSWAEKRSGVRRIVHFPCRAYSMAPTNACTRLSLGTLRDLSSGGLSFVAKEHFTRRTHLVIFVPMAPEAGVRRLSGQVIYSRMIEETWHLTGVKFCSVSDELLMEATRQDQLDERKIDPSPPSRTVARPNLRDDAAVGTRERALQVLAAVRASRTVTKDVIDKVMMFTVSPSHEVRRATIPALLSLPERHAVSSLIQLLNDSNPGVQMDAAAALGRIRAKAAIDPLRKLLASRNREEVSLMAAEALAKMEDQRGLDLLMRILHSDSPLNRRAAHALGSVLGLSFRATADGVARARQYFKHNKSS